MDIKIAFFDIDGTLIDSATGIFSEKTVYCLQTLRRRGIKTCVVTGRSTYCFPDFGPLEFDAFASSNGALCYTAKEVIFSNAIEPRDVERLIQNAAALGLPVAVAGKDGASANGSCQDLADYYTLASLELTVDPDFDAYCRQPIYKVMIGCREAQHEALLQGTTSVKLAISWDRAVDIVPKAAGKGAGIQSILDHFGLTPSQAIAFGDSYNDLEMFRSVGHSVAMGNAVEDLKALASEVCPSVSQDGVYHYRLAKGLLG